MKKSALIDLSIKIVGILQIPVFFYSAVQVISYLIFYAAGDYQMLSSWELSLLYIVTSIVPLIVYAGVIYQLIFHSTFWVRKIMKHETEEEIIIKAEHHTILQIAIVIAAMVVFFWNFPPLIVELRAFVLSKIVTNRDFIPANFESKEFIQCLIALILSLIMFTWSQAISLFLARRIPKAIEIKHETENIDEV